MLMLQGTFEASFDQPLPGSGNRVDAGVQRGGDLTIAPSFAVVRGIRLQQDACPQQLSRGVLALVDREVSCSRSSSLSFTTYFLTAISFLATNPLRCWGGNIESEIGRRIKDASH